MHILDKFRLEGKVAVITGASKGIGESIARALGQVGAKVVVSSRKQEAVDEVAQEFHKEGIEAIAIAAHNGSIEDVHRLIDSTVSHFGKVDIIINNAATNPAPPFTTATDATAFDKIMEVNLKGVFELCKRAYPELKKTKGSVINISSVAGIRADERTGIYSVSKAGLISLTHVLAKEWGVDGIRVNALCPGLVQTKLSEALWKNEAVYKQIIHFVPMKRMAQPEEMAGLALFLASDASSYCTGAVFVADGGLIA
jgi:NAD(P)-dependent dehydrogenase (short-subunit alcohol dehydrogenase family)